MPQSCCVLFCFTFKSVISCVLILDLLQEDRRVKRTDSLALKLKLQHCFFSLLFSLQSSLFSLINLREMFLLPLLHGVVQLSTSCSLAISNKTKKNNQPNKTNPQKNPKPTNKTKTKNQNGTVKRNKHQVHRAQRLKQL